MVLSSRGPSMGSKCRIEAVPRGSRPPLVLEHALAFRGSRRRPHRSVNGLELPSAPPLVEGPHVSRCEDSGVKCRRRTLETAISRPQACPSTPTIDPLDRQSYGPRHRTQRRRISTGAPPAVDGVGAPRARGRHRRPGRGRLAPRGFGGSPPSARARAACPPRAQSSPWLDRRASFERDPERFLRHVVAVRGSHESAGRAARPVDLGEQRFGLQASGGVGRARRL